MGANQWGRGWTNGLLLWVDLSPCSRVNNNGSWDAVSTSAKQLSSFHGIKIQHFNPGIKGICPVQCVPYPIQCNILCNTDTKVLNAAVSAKTKKLRNTKNVFSYTLEQQHSAACKWRDISFALPTMARQCLKQTPSLSPINYVSHVQVWNKARKSHVQLWSKVHKSHA